MKALPMKLVDGSYVPCAPNEAGFVQLNMPGPISTHMIPVHPLYQRLPGVAWKWNGSTTHPTLDPSILIRTADEHGPIVCHSFVREGMIEFLPDCTHALAGKTVPLLEVEE